MKKHRYWLICLPVLIACALLLRFPDERMQDVPASLDPQTVPVNTAESSMQALFPKLGTNGVTTVQITTPQSAFELRWDGKKAVSVNGQRGDSDVFATLLEQIAGMNCVPTEPFTADEAPLLTLIVYQNDAEYTAHFYNDGATGEHARIITKQPDNMRYGMTDGWRVGTLLLACEGMRIQDASGRETPAE